MSLYDHPHRRWNPLAGEWVLVSPHRMKRPWQGQVEAVTPSPSVTHDPACYLCPGNERAGGHRNPAYDGVFVFDNDFAALYPQDPAPPPADVEGLLLARAESGRCRVLCFSPDHSLTLSRMALPALRAVVDAWIAETRSLAADPALAAIQIFENRGEMMGCSNPHPHGQIWATGSIPNLLAREVEALRSFDLSAYLALELRLGERVVAVNDHFAALVPFWATWPFEILLLPRRPSPSILDLTGPECDAFAALLQETGRRYDALFGVPFPYTMGIHQQPFDGGAYSHFHWHAHYYPPLLRSATVRKFMVGFEMLAEPQRDLTPEAAALRLRELSLPSKSC